MKASAIIPHVVRIESPYGSGAGSGASSAAGSGDASGAESTKSNE